MFSILDAFEMTAKKYSRNEETAVNAGSLLLGKLDPPPLLSGTGTSRSTTRRY